MIHIFEITAPEGEVPAAKAVSMLTVAMARIMGAFPALRDATVTQDPEGVLRLRLRVVGRDRWLTSRRAREIGSSMLRRVKVAEGVAKMELVEAIPSANKLTKEQGRNVANHRPRSKTGHGIEFPRASEDPS